MKTQHAETKRATLTIPEWLTIRARRVGLTAREIAARTKYSESYVGLILNGKRDAWEAREDIMEVLRLEELKQNGTAEAA